MVEVDRQRRRDQDRDSETDQQVKLPVAKAARRRLPGFDFAPGFRESVFTVVTGAPSGLRPVVNTVSAVATRACTRGWRKCRPLRAPSPQTRRPDCHAPAGPSGAGGPNGTTSPKIGMALCSRRREQASKSRVEPALYTAVAAHT